jgi:hypothetical protein
MQGITPTASWSRDPLPPPIYPEPKDIHIGISFSCSEGQAPVITAVDNGSVAHNAGLLTGDRVLSVSAAGTFGLAEILLNGVPTTRVNVKGFPANQLISLLKQTFEAVREEGGKVIIQVERGQGGRVHMFSSIFSYPYRTGSGMSGANVLESGSRAPSPSAVAASQQQLPLPPTPSGQHGLVPLSYLRPLSSTGQKATQPAVKGGKYGCEWHGCGFKEDSFDLVANHEKTCAYRGGQKKNVPSPAPNKANYQKDSPESGAPPYSTKAEKGGKYGCEWLGCGFQDNSFDLVANHERTCAMRDGQPTTASAGMPSQQPLIMGTNGSDPAMVQYTPPADSKQTVQIGFG